MCWGQWKGEGPRCSRGEEIAERVEIGSPAPKGVIDCAALAVRLKAYPDTEPLLGFLQFAGPVDDESDRLVALGVGWNVNDEAFAVTRDIVLATYLPHVKREAEQGTWSVDLQTAAQRVHLHHLKIALIPEENFVAAPNRLSAAIG